MELDARLKCALGAKGTPLQAAASAFPFNVFLFGHIQIQSFLQPLSLLPQKQHPTAFDIYNNPICKRLPIQLANGHFVELQLTASPPKFQSRIHRLQQIQRPP